MEPETAKRVAAGTIALVARNGAACLGELDSYLVPPARLKGQLHQAEPVTFPQYPVSGYGTQCAFGSGGRLPDTVRVNLGQPGVEYTFGSWQAAFDEGHVGALVNRFIPGGHERGLGPGGLGKNDDTRGFAVEPLDDSGPSLGVALLDVRCDDVVQAF